MLHLDCPFTGSRMLQGPLRGEGLENGQLYVTTLMKKMGTEAIYRRPNTSKPAPGHKIYSCLLRKLAVTWPNQLRAMDITYVPMAREASISAPSSTGSAGRSCRGGYRSRWKRPSASKR